MPTISYSQNYALSGERINASISVTDSGMISIDEVVPGAGNISVPFNVAAAKLSSIYVSIDGADPVTMQLNGAGATITLSPGIPWMWVKGSGLPSPVSADLTSLKFTKTPAGPTNVKVRCSYDAT